MPLRQSALIARPVSSSITIDAAAVGARCARGRRQCQVAGDAADARRRPAAPRRPGSNCAAPCRARRYSAAPSAAPLDVPTSPGSTIGLRKSACIRVPPTPRLAPTNRHSSARGSRSSVKMRPSSVAARRAAASAGDRRRPHLPQAGSRSRRTGSRRARSPTISDEQREENQAARRSRAVTLMHRLVNQLRELRAVLLPGLGPKYISSCSADAIDAAGLRGAARGDARQRLRPGPSSQPSRS